MTDFFVLSACLVDKRVSEEVESSLNTGIMKNNQTTLFQRQNRVNQRLVSTAHKTRKETVLQDSLSGIQSRIDVEKAARQQLLLHQCEYKAALQALTENGVAGTSRISIALFEETSQLRKKITNEKELCRRITITQSSLMDELSEISASASGKPGATGKRLRKVNPGGIEASSSGRVSVAFHGTTEEAGLYPFFAFNWCPYTMLLTDCTASPADESILKMAQRDPDAKVGSYSDGMFFQLWFYIDDQSVSRTGWQGFLQRKCLRKRMIPMLHLMRRSTRTSILLTPLSPIHWSSQMQVQSLKKRESTLSRSNHWPSETIQVLMVSARLVSHIQALVLTWFCLHWL